MPYTVTGAMPYTVRTITPIALGMLVLVLASWRLVIRLRIGAPPPPEGEPEIATVAAKVAHVAPDALLVALRITGLAAWFLGAEGLAVVHAYGSTALLWLLGAHVLAVVVHQIRWKTDLLRRMA